MEEIIVHKCKECGASLKKYWHRMTPGLVKTLVKVYQGVSEKRENHINKKDLDLTHSEYGNFQKLRFHGMIAKYKEDGVNWIRGNWLLTRNGAAFLKGEIDTPQRVLTFRNHVEDHSPERVKVGEVMKNHFYWEQEFNYEIFEPKQAELL